MADVFISYKAEDRPRVAPLVAALASEGLSVWWDAHISGGEEWRETIQAELEAARCVVVVWSSRSVGPEGRFVRDEATRAERRGVYLPVRIDPVEPPLGFGETQALNLIGWRGDRDDPCWEQLVDAIRAVIARKPRRRVAPVAAGVRPNRRALIAGGGAVAAAALAGWWWRTREADGGGGRLAVLPFANLSGDPAQAYLGDGIAEELRTALSRLPGVQVMSRMSSEAVRGLDAATAATRLDVRDILSGSVRRSAELVRVSAQLVNGRTGVERWSDSYDRQNSDVLSIQSEIAQRVALALSASLAPGEAASLALAGTTNTAAHDLLLRARELNAAKDDEASLRQVLSLTEAALALDARYADAQSLKAGTMANLAIFFTAAEDQKPALDAAMQAARRAVALDPQLPAGHSVLAFILKSQLDFRGALAAYRRANAREPDARALIGYSFFLAEMGRAEEAMRPAERAVATDPLNPNAFAVAGNARYFAGDHQAAIETLRRMMRMAPDRYYARYFIGLSLMWLGRLDEALKEFGAMPAGDLFRNAGEAILGARSGNRAASDRATAAVAEAGATMLLAAIRAQRGEREQAFALLDEAWANRSPDLAALRADRLYDPLRPDLRFKALAAKLDFP